LLRAGQMLRHRLPRTAQGTSSPAPDLPPPAAIPEEQLARTLESLGIHPGDVLMLHSDYGGVSRLGWAGPDFIEFLLKYLGSGGTLLMPSHPRLKQELGRPVYDVRRSPSSVGLLTEMFRRRKTARRSEYPFSACAAEGRLAADLLEAHRGSFAPHDALSPYARLVEAGGKVLALGCALDRMTILHVAEDTAEDLGIPGFYETEEVLVRSAAGETLVQTHRRAGWLWWYIAKYQWTSQMHRGGFVRTGALNGVRMFQVDAAPVIQWMQAQALRGQSLYPLARHQRWLNLRAPALEQA
jgi:aminoglycoside 3-N-acetyltransferase